MIQGRVFGAQLDRPAGDSAGWVELNMMKVIAPLALIAALPLMEPATAGSVCPAGQIYRVSLHVCASKAANMKFYHPLKSAAAARPRQPAPDGKSARPATQISPVNPASADPGPVAEEDPAPAYAPAPVPVDPIPVRPAQETAEPASPFGALRPVFGFQ